MFLEKNDYYLHQGARGVKQNLSKGENNL